jgi:protein-disulfide isomerase
MNKPKIILSFAAALAAALVAISAASAQVSDEEFKKAFDKFAQSAEGKKAIGQAAQSYFEELRKDFEQKQKRQQEVSLEEQFKNPIKVDVANRPAKGPQNARVTIIEYSDFQCPFCKRGADTMTKVAESYPNDVKIVFKQLPLAFHPHALPAAKAALAADKQGKFWEMHDALFTNQASLSEGFYAEKAQSLGLNVEQFKRDMESAEIAKLIEEDKAEAEKAGISGTPGFLVNGVAVKGAYPFEHFKGIIDRWLAGGAAQ